MGIVTALPASGGPSALGDLGNVQNRFFVGTKGAWMRLILLLVCFLLTFGFAQSAEERQRIAAIVASAGGLAPKEVKVLGTTLQITVRPDSVWDERDFAQRAIQHLTKTAKPLFAAYTKINLYRVIAVTEFTSEDAFGNQTSTIRPGATLAVTRAVNNRANWKNLEFQCRKVINILEEVRFHPAIGRAIAEGTRGCWAE
jgi:hypothetical protein